MIQLKKTLGASGARRQEIAPEAPERGGDALHDPRRRAVLRTGSALFFGAAAVAWLAACGGGDDGAMPASPSGGGSGGGGGGSNGGLPPPPDDNTGNGGNGGNGGDDGEGSDKPNPFPDATTVALRFPQNFRIATQDIFVAILGRSPGSSVFGFVNPCDATFTPAGTADTFRMDAASMSFRVSDLPRSAGTRLMGLPPLESGRVYIAFGQNFDAMPAFGAGGPMSGPENPVIYEKFELDTATNPNANVTNVDFFSMSYKLSATDRNTGVPRTLGFSASRQSVLGAFAAIPVLNSDQGGDSRVFANTVIRNANGDVVRILSPKAAGLSDWEGGTIDQKVANAQRFTHFWDRYVNEHCWRPNREFQCFGKDPKGPSYYGRVDASGTRVMLFTDSGRTQPYTIPSLPRPSAPLGMPDYMPGSGRPELYHNCDSGMGAIDWGFLLGGNAGGAGDGANWNSDPVAIAIVMAICRGVMHLDDGFNDWTDKSKFYRGNGAGVATADMPIFWYGKILHEMSIDESAYALSFDDVYGAEPSIYFERTGTVSVEFMAL